MWRLMQDIRIYYIIQEELKIPQIEGQTTQWLKKKDNVCINV